MPPRPLSTTTLPFPAAIRCGSAARTGRTVPSSLASITFCQASSSRLRKSPKIGRLVVVTRPSSRPKRATISAAAASTAGVDVTSSASGTMPSPTGSASGRRPEAITLAPCAASASALARPRAPAAPVTQMTRPLKSYGMGLVFPVGGPALLPAYRTCSNSTAMSSSPSSRWMRWIRLSAWDSVSGLGP